MKEIVKKVNREHFEKILTGEKKFELRLADEEYILGEILVLKEVDEEKKFTGREIKKKITSILKTRDCNFWPSEKIDKYGFIIMSLE
jgi:hypothetical protein